MLKFIMRKTIYKDYDRETQDMLIALMTKMVIAQYSSFLIWPLLFGMTFLPVIVMGTLEGIETKFTTDCAIVALEIFYFILFVLLYLHFPSAVGGFSLALGNRLYFNKYTKQGRALSKEDFKLLYEVCDKLPVSMEHHICVGCCYSVAYELLKALKKGEIKLIAMKNLRYKDGSIVSDDKIHTYTMHALYVNNGWCFDSYSIRQYPLGWFMGVCGGKEYRTISYGDIRDTEYEDFMRIMEPCAKEWADRNDCHVDFSMTSESETGNVTADDSGQDSECPDVPNQDSGCHATP